MNKVVNKSMITVLALLSVSSFASVNDGLSSCRFSSKIAAQDYARAIDGSSRAAARLNPADLAQVEACSSAVAVALKNGFSYTDISNQVNTKGNFFRNGIQATVELRSIEAYNAKGKLLTGSSSKVEGDFDMVISIEGERNEISQGIPTELGENSMKIEVLDKNHIRLTDEESGLDAKVKAIIKKSLFGKIKQVSVHAQDLEAALRPILDEKGITLAKGLNMKTEEGSFAMDYEVSAMDCAYFQDDIFECKSSFIFKMSVQF